ncbi:MAG: stage II sporulation protein P [Oscillospiraceae bacterium]|nr:stage II sporulation protein P [Oscillospiraceae bacterium]MBQ6160120.1 stage II sporulation protein P [Oscillospiraceae bacterium]
MYPILYRRKTRTRYFAALLLLALGLRLFCQPELRQTLLERSRAALSGGALFRAALFLETGLRAEPAPAGSLSDPSSTEDPDPVGSDALIAPPSSGPPSAEDTPSVGSDALIAPTSSAFPATAEAEAADAPAPFTAAEAEAIRFRGNCDYEADKTALLLRPLGWGRAEGPRVLIIHSHSCEAYTQSEGHTYIPDANYRTLDQENSVIAVGDALAEALGDLGVKVLHDRSYNDYPSYNSSYSVAREKIQDYLDQYPSLTMVIDLHRDALDEPVRETVEWEGQTLAPLMLVVGTDEGGLHHPHWEDNLSCALKLQALGNRLLPGLFKKLSFRRERFNEDLTPGSLIVEVGSTGNTLPEALASMPWLARCVAELLRCP